MNGAYLGRITILYNATGPASCWAFFDGGSIAGVNQELGWKRLNGGPSAEANIMYVTLAAEAKSDGKRVAINFAGDDVTQMWVFDV
jgi:hypothetical protein